MIIFVSQKSVPKTVNPFAAIMFAYVIGAALCAIGLAFNRSGATLLDSVKYSNWAVVGLGVGALIIEVGFLRAYRAGWNISLASVVTNISVALILIPIGQLVFKECLSLRSVAGITCCLLSLYLITKK